MTAKKNTKSPAPKPEKPAASTGLLDQARAAALEHLKATPEGKSKKGAKPKSTPTTAAVTPVAPEGAALAAAPEGAPAPAVAQDVADGATSAPAVTAGEPAVGDNAKKAKEPKAPKPLKAPKENKPRRLSALDAAAQVIASSDKPMRATDMIAEMEAKGLWRSPGGKTPEATLYAAIIREVAAKGKDARFVKHDRGLFVAGTRL